MSKILRALATQINRIWANTALRWTPHKWQPYLFNRYVAFSAFMIFYTTALQLTGGLPSLLHHFFYEAPFLLGAYYLLNSLLKSGQLSAWAAALPLVLAYTAYDAFYVAYGAVFRVVTLGEVPELVDVLPISYKLAFSTVIGIPLVFFLCHLDFKKYKPAVAGGLSILGLVSVTELSPKPIISAFENVGAGIAPWSEVKSVESKGRFGMLFYFESRRRQAQADTVAYHNRQQYEQDINKIAEKLRAQTNHRNVHLVLLESFLDPTLLKTAKFSKDPRHPDFIAGYADNMGFSIAPVFGGSTAQSEFETLCGVPAFRKVNNIEFNAFGGAPAYCMPGILAKAGYQSLASNGFKPNFFNTVKAYQGIGFEEMYFPTEYAKQLPTYLSTGPIASGEYYMFDQPLYEQNLAFIKKRMQEQPNKPILNFLQTVYGHFPHYMDPAKRPQVVSVEASYHDEQLVRVVNQHYYRTKALAFYLNELTKLDPNSLIILYSDHLPPLLEGTQSYKKLGYLDNVEGSTFMNRVIIIENGKFMKYPALHHYDIPSLIYNYITDGKYCAENPCNHAKIVRARNDYENEYMRIMAHVVDDKK